MVVIPAIIIPNGWNYSGYTKPEDRSITVEYVNSDKTIGITLSFQKRKDATLHYEKDGIKFKAYRYHLGDGYWEYIK